MLTVPVCIEERSDVASSVFLATSCLIVLRLDDQWHVIGKPVCDQFFSGGGRSTLDEIEHLCAWCRQKMGVHRLLLALASGFWSISAAKLDDR